MHIKNLYAGVAALFRNTDKASEPDPQVIQQTASEPVLEPVEPVLVELVPVKELIELRELRDLIAAMFEAGEREDPIKYICLGFNPKLPHPQEAPNVVRMHELAFTAVVAEEK